MSSSYVPKVLYPFIFVIYVGKPSPGFSCTSADGFPARLPALPCGQWEPLQTGEQVAAGMAGGTTRMCVPGPKRQKILRGGSKVSGTEEVKKGPEFGDGSEQLSVK